MQLTKTQKKFIKRHLRDLSFDQIANTLNISEKEIVNFVKSNWPQEKQLPKSVSPSTPDPLMSLKTSIKQNWKTLLFLAVLVFTVYFNSLGNDFVSDDIIAIRGSPDISTTDYLTYYQFNPRSIILFVTHKIFGFIPAFFRLSNILFHLGSSWLVFIVMTYFFASPIPLVTAAIFAVHPVLAESVTWISGGPYSNGAFFFFLSLLTYLKFRNSGKTEILLISLSSYGIALLFNNRLIILPLILLLHEFCSNTIKQHWKKLTSFVIICTLGIFYTFGLLGPKLTSLNTSSYQEPGLYNPLLQIPVAITSYLELIFWPINLTLYHSEMNFSQVEYFIRLGIFILFLVIAGLFFKKDKRVFFWLSVFMISLLPTLTPLKIAWVVAERYVYLGSIGVFVLVAFLIQKVGVIRKNLKISYVIFAFLIILLSIRTIIRNTDWKNQDTLWLATAKVSPSSAQNHNNLGDYYGRHGNLEKSAEEFQTAIMLLPGYADAYHNLANTYQQMGKIDLALENYQKALQFNPNLWQSSQNLAIMYSQQNKFDLATKELTRALTINPQNPNLHLVLGIIYLNTGKKNEAKKEFEQVLKIDPSNQNAKIGLIEATK